MNTKNLILVFLFHILGLVLPDPKRIIRFLRVDPNSQNMEGMQMKSRELLLTTLSLNRKSVVPIPKGSFKGVRLLKVLIICLVFSLVMVPYGQVWAASFTVNSTADQPDVSPGDGICRTASNNCTLRAAIMEANASPGADTITLSAGVYALGIPTVNE